MTTTVIEESSTVILSDKAALKEQEVSNGFFSFFQFLAWPISFVCFHVRYKIHVKGIENFRRAPHPLIIVANHISFSDSFLLHLVEGISSPHRPFRFTGVRKFNWGWLNFLGAIGFIDLIYKLFGVITVVPGQGLDKNLEEAKEILKEGGVVVMYPEGRIMTDNKIGVFKVGASVLALQTGAMVLPVSFRRGRRRWIRKDLFVNIAQPITIFGSIEEGTNKMHNSISTLYFEEF